MFFQKVLGLEKGETLKTMKITERQCCRECIGLKMSSSLPELVPHRRKDMDLQTGAVAQVCRFLDLVKFCQNSQKVEE